MTEETELVKVFCRLRPSFNEDEEPCVLYETKNHIEYLRTIPPAGARRNVKEATHMFSRIFTKDNGQSEIYEDVAYPLVQELLEGKNSLLFTYGVTGSGKTFTMQGSENVPGIVPRTLKSIFRRINLISRNRVQSDRRNGFKIVNEIDVMDLMSKNKNSSRRSGDDVCTTYLSKIADIEDIDTRVNNCTVFLSLVEIYGKRISDLLAPKSDIQKVITIKEDSKKNKYLHNVVEVEVQTADEALQWYLKGQKIRKVESTNLNHESSRSHMVFNIRLVKVDDQCSGSNYLSDIFGQRKFSNNAEECQTADRSLASENCPPNWKLENCDEALDQLWSSQLSLVDLAGSERATRSGANGTRLKEAGDINISLMTLRRCMETLRGKNSSYADKPDYRSNELTHLFKTTLEGGSALRMIVCVQSCPAEYDETMNVLGFAENSQEIAMPVQKNPDAFRALKPLTESNVNLSKVDQIEKKLKDYGRLVSSMRMIDDKNRESDMDSMDCILKLCELSNSTIECVAEWFNMHIEECCNSSNDQVEALTTKLAKERIAVSHYKKQHSDDLEKISEKELQLSKSQMELANMRKSLSKKDETLRLHEVQLNRKSEEVLYLESKLMQQQENNSSRGNLTLPVKAMVKKFERNNVIDCSSKKFVKKVEPAPIPTGNNRKGFFNPRYRKSNSKERWVEHTEKHEIPTGTLNQVRLKGKTQTKNPNLDTLKKADKYMLTHQTVDSDADVKVSTIKGTIIPTAGRGVAVSYYDMETVEHSSPLKWQQKNHKRHSSLSNDDDECLYKRHKNDSGSA